jgi:hypothetical protein
MKSRNEVRQTKDERKVLTGKVKRGKGHTYRIKHAHILFNADQETKEPEKSDEEIDGLFQWHSQTFFNTRKKYCENGLYSVIERKQGNLGSVEILIEHWTPFDFSGNAQWKKWCISTWSL